MIDSIDKLLKKIETLKKELDDLSTSVDKLSFDKSSKIHLPTPIFVEDTTVGNITFENKCVYCGQIVFEDYGPILYLGKNKAIHLLCIYAYLHMWIDQRMNFIFKRLKELRRSILSSRVFKSFVNDKENLIKMYEVYKGVGNLLTSVRYLMDDLKQVKRNYRQTYASLKNFYNILEDLEENIYNSFSKIIRGKGLQETDIKNFNSAILQTYIKGLEDLESFSETYKLIVQYMNEYSKFLINKNTQEIINNINTLLKKLSSDEIARKVKNVKLSLSDEKFIIILSEIFDILGLHT